jgi:hypothetical protein
MLRLAAPPLCLADASAVELPMAMAAAANPIAISRSMMRIKLGDLCLGCLAASGSRCGCALRAVCTFFRVGLLWIALAKDVSTLRDDAGRAVPITPQNYSIWGISGRRRCELR